MSDEIERIERRAMRREVTINGDESTEAELLSVPDGYDRRQFKQMIVCRRMTLDEIKVLTPGQRVDFISTNGTLRQCTINGRIQRWVREPDRIEVPVKYGLYETARLKTAEALSVFVVRVDD